VTEVSVVIDIIGYNIVQGRYIASDLDMFSMANVAAGSRLLWIHLASAYVVTVITLRVRARFKPTQYCGFIALG
jgi:hypothetical protein